MRVPDCRKWRKGDPEGVRDLPTDVYFATVDPGADGVALIFAPLTRWRDDVLPRPIDVVRLRNERGALALGQRCAERGVRQVFIEEPFAGRQNVQSALRTSRTVGFVAGAVHYAASARTPTSILVPAQSWQSKVIPRSLGERAERKAAMMEIAKVAMGDHFAWERAGKEQRTAIADALGMAIWRAGIAGLDVLNRETRKASS